MIQQDTGSTPPTNVLLYNRNEQQKFSKAVREKLGEVEKEENDEERVGGEVVLERSYEFPGRWSWRRACGKTVFKTLIVVDNF